MEVQDPEGTLMLSPVGLMKSHRNEAMQNSNLLKLKTTICPYWTNLCLHQCIDIRTHIQMCGPKKINSFDAFIFVTPEYNHAPTGALKNAIDYLYVEWNNKAAGFVSFGSAGGVRAVEQLRVIMGEIQVADVRTQVALSLYTDFENFSIFKPLPNHEAILNTVIDQVIEWGTALKPMRK